MTTTLLPPRPTTTRTTDHVTAPSTTAPRTDRAAVTGPVRPTPGSRGSRRPLVPLTATARRAEQSALVPPAPVPVHVAGRSDGRPADPTGLACAIVQAAVESLRGIRPVAQLARWLAPEIQEALVRRASVTLADPSGTRRPARVRRARVHRVDDRSAEATVVVEDADRVRAAALRLEHVRGAWRVTALVLG